MAFTRRSMIAWSITIAGLTPGVGKVAAPAVVQARGTAVRYSVREQMRLEPTTAEGSGAAPGRLTDFNDRGDISGTRTISPDRSGPMVWSTTGEEFQAETGRFGGIIHALSLNGHAAGTEYLSPNGESTPVSGTAQAYTRPRAWRDGAAIELLGPDQGGGAQSGEAVDVNDDGMVIGVVTVAGDDQVPIAWDDTGTGVVLEVPGDGHARPWTINRASVIAGSANQRLVPEGAGSYVPVPIVWRGWMDGQVRAEILPFPESQPRPDDFPGVHLAMTFVGLSDTGSVISGYSSHLGESVYRYDGRQPVRLNEGFDFRALAMNERGSIVGLRMDDGVDRATLVLWKDGSFRQLETELPDLGNLTLRSIVGINAQGEIAAAASDSDGALLGLVFTPIEQDPA